MRRAWTVVLIFFTIAFSAGQDLPADGRYKADILLVVAHPDDDTLVASYLARAIYDQHKHVAVIYCTRGDSGGNAVGREHARALGAVREIEGRRALAVLGITNVWFLDGRDTASQNVLGSLGSWPHGTVLEQAVRIMRLTRPEVVLTWLPSSVAGENHGDHQAAGVIATEAFDLAGSPAAFPAQLAVPVRSLENALEGLTPWQPKKLYYFTDAFDDSFMQDKGPAYSIKDVSPSRKVSYLRLTLDEFAPYYSQSPDPRMNQQIEKGENVDAILKRVSEGPGAYISDPLRFLLGKTHVPSGATADIFAGITPAEIKFAAPRVEPTPEIPGLAMELGGTWGFYHDFWRAHDLRRLAFRHAEIAIQPGETLRIPLVLTNHLAEPREFTITVALPPGWTQNNATAGFTVAAGEQSRVSVEIKAPPQENRSFQEIDVTAQSNREPAGTITLYVQTRYGVFPQPH